MLFVVLFFLGFFVFNIKEVRNIIYMLYKGLRNEVLIVYVVSISNKF